MMLSSPLSEADYSRLEAMLRRLRSGRAMNLEEVDGFFAALLCAPELVPPSEYLPQILGGHEPAWNSPEELQGFVDLLMRHWNSVASAFESGVTFKPRLLKQADGLVHGNDWARGFMRGVALGEDDWREFFWNEANFGLMIPVLALFHEHDEDPEMRPYAEPISSERREKLIAGLSSSVTDIHRRLASARRMNADMKAAVASPRRALKIGRNELCPCGSGKKHKRCCGSATIH